MMLAWLLQPHKGLDMPVNSFKRFVPQLIFKFNSLKLFSFSIDGLHKIKLLHEGYTRL